MTLRLVLAIALCIGAIVAGSSKNKVVDNAYDGHPPQHRGVRWVPYDEKMAHHTKAGYTWPQRRKFKGWPPVPDGEHSEEYIKTRLQIEGEFRRIPMDVHHRLDDFEAFTERAPAPTLD